VAIVVIAIALTVPATPSEAQRSVVQNGPRNYAGAHCPGRAWNCTTKTNHVVQNGTHNVFDCRRRACSVEQHASDGGSNEARCIQSVNRQAHQRCSILQTNGNGPNTIAITQAARVTARRGNVDQSSSQTVVTDQTSTAGTNTLSVLQSVAQSAMSKRRRELHSHTQEASELIDAMQSSTSGDQVIDVSQGQELSSQTDGPGSIQQQNATDDGPDVTASVVQHTGSGQNELLAAQRQRLAQATAASVATQTQGAETSGEEFVGDIDSDGAAGGRSNVRITQVKEWVQEAPAGSAQQTQTDKIRIRLIPLTLTPDTVDTDQQTTLRSGADALQRCTQSAEIRARLLGVSDATCTVDDGTGSPIVSSAHEEGTAYVLENQAPVTASTLTGTVRDARNGAPVAGATVAVNGDQVTTGPDGTYVIDALDPGAYTIVVSAPTYITASRQITLDPGEQRQEDFTLQPASQPGP
jgi:hypothetical protein